MKTYKESIEKRINFNSRKSKNNENKLFTVEKICELCNIKYKKDSIGLSLKKSFNFFQKYKLGMKAIDMFGNDIIDYIPDEFNKSISPRTLYIY